eukprot:scaffold4537_cov144-Isochrysis_galbana.AAC.4
MSSGVSRSPASGPASFPCAFCALYRCLSRAYYPRSRQQQLFFLPRLGWACRSRESFCCAVCGPGPRVPGLLVRLVRVIAAWRARTGTVVRCVYGCSSYTATASHLPCMCAHAHAHARGRIRVYYSLARGLTPQGRRSQIDTSIAHIHSIG